VGYVYFLELSNGDIYVGSTDDLRRHFKSHQQGHVLSTRNHLPAVLRAYVAVPDEATARSLERYFKSGSGKAFCKQAVLEWPALIVHLTHDLTATPQCLKGHGPCPELTGHVGSGTCQTAERM
jgi:predicted GIY-YIG superfamily endonuclease